MTGRRSRKSAVMQGNWVRQGVSVGLVLTAVLFGMAGFVNNPLVAAEEPVDIIQPISQADTSSLEAETVVARDSGRPVRLSRADGTVEELTMEEYLWGVVAAEMPATFELEALKAQAVAARTYAVTKQETENPNHPDADLCDDSSCCQAYLDEGDMVEKWGMSAQEYAEKITQAVAETDGLGVLYKGSPIQAVFFSSAAGQTEDAVAVWGNDVDYLVGVDSPEGEEVPNYHSQVALSQEEVQEKILAAYPGADLSGRPENWMTILSRTSSGGVEEMTVGGISLTGGQVRTLFDLRSASFDLQWSGTEFLFDVTGYGHGVGMSQYGANALAEQGADFQEILTWYYTGTQVENLY